jgi:tetratricopeptide (TPR) repeat protein
VLIDVARALPFLEPPGRAVQLVERAFRLNPHPPMFYYSHARNPYYYAGQFEKVIAVIKAKGDQPHDIELEYLAMSYAQLGRDAEAREAAAQRMQKDPDFSAERVLGESGDFASAAASNRALTWRACAGRACRSARPPSSSPSIRASSAYPSVKPSERGPQQPDRNVLSAKA